MASRSVRRSMQHIRAEWDGADRRYFSEHAMALLLAETVEVAYRN